MLAHALGKSWQRSIMTLEGSALCSWNSASMQDVRLSGESIDALWSSCFEQGCGWLPPYLFRWASSELFPDWLVALVLYFCFGNAKVSQDVWFSTDAFQFALFGIPPAKRRDVKHLYHAIIFCLTNYDLKNIPRWNLQTTLWFSTF